MTMLSQRWEEGGENKLRGEILITHNFHFQVVVWAGGIYSEKDRLSAGSDETQRQGVSLSVRVGGVDPVLDQSSLPLPLVGGGLCK